MTNVIQFPFKKHDNERRYVEIVCFAMGLFERFASEIELDACDPKTRFLLKKFRSRIETLSEELDNIATLLGD